MENWRINMTKLLTTAAMLAALAVSAQATETVNGWKVDYYPDIFNGACAAGVTYKGGTFLSFAKIYRDDTTKWSVMLLNKAWTWTKDNHYEVVVTVGPEGKPPVKTLTTTFWGLEKGGGLLMNRLTADEMNTFAVDGDATVVFWNKKDGKKIESLKIDKSAMVIRALGNCLKAYEP